MIMAFAADILLIAGALGAGLYCLILSRRLTKFTDLEKGVGGAVAVLSVQVDDMSKALNAAQSAANDSTESLSGLTDRAEDVAKRLELLVASMHDLPVDGDGGDGSARLGDAPKADSLGAKVARNEAALSEEQGDPLPGMFQSNRVNGRASG